MRLLSIIVALIFAGPALAGDSPPPPPHPCPPHFTWSAVAKACVADGH